MSRRRFLQARRAASQDGSRLSDRVAIASVLAGGLLVAWFVIAQVGFSTASTPSVSNLLADNAGQAPHVQAGFVPGQTPPAAAQAPAAATIPPATASAATPPAATPTPAAEPGRRRQVAHTDGQGVVLRASPREDDKVPRGFMDGDWVTMLDQSGPDWDLVQGDNGLQGWVPARYLSP